MIKIKKTFIVFLFPFFQMFAQNSYAQEDFKDLPNCESLINIGKTEAERIELQKDYWILLGILDDLNKYRQAFLSEGQLINLFPTAYYHTTFSEMKNIASLKFYYPIEKMRQMIAFYDAYKWNRNQWEQNTGLCESHWLQHFQHSNRVLTNFDFFCSTIGDNLGTAILAHVYYDLPRALRYARNHKFNIQASDNVLQKDFEKTNEIFQESMYRTISDISKIKNCWEDYLIIASQMDFLIKFNNCINRLPGFSNAKALTASDVKKMRMDSWKRAVSAEIFKDYDESNLINQPHGINHNDLITIGKDISPSKEIVGSEETSFTINPKDVTLPTDKQFKWYKWESAPQDIKTASKYIKTYKTISLFDEIKEDLENKCDIQIAVTDFNNDGIAGLSIYESGNWCCGTLGCTYRFYDNGGLLMIDLGTDYEVTLSNNGVISSAKRFFPLKKNIHISVNEDKIKRLFSYKKLNQNPTPIQIGNDALVGGSTPDELGQIIFKALKMNDKKLYASCIHPNPSHNNRAEMEKEFDELREAFEERGLTNWNLAQYSRVTFTRSTGGWAREDNGERNGQQVRREFTIEFTYNNDFIGSIDASTIITYNKKFFIWESISANYLRRY